MFGMTKKQFLKKSKNCLKDTGIQLLLIREIFSKESTGKLDFDNAYHKLDKIRKNMENIFFKFEGLKPPSKCKSLQREILNTLIILQEVIVVNSEYIMLSKDGFTEESQEKFKKSIDDLENFRNKFRELSQKIDLYLRR
ncbi:hypothetical protein [Methanobacterium sp.]|uniref:hypothetical protein n=1 Tax=Methanobacterium sp. TaxID=2164 RepID=UPI002AB95F7F|nr:hypothetical protein [Methanobacterium sp.]MDY9924070.1 hypothetical protein [Methanobacterium sp.]